MVPGNPRGKRRTEARMQQFKLELFKRTGIDFTKAELRKLITDYEKERDLENSLDEILHARKNRSK